MKYQSTRGGVKGITFEEAVMRGLAEDGGLFVPASIPSVDWDTLRSWKDLKFDELCVKVLRLFIAEEEISTPDLAEIAKKSFSTFSHEHVTPVNKISKDLYILELFHGPTFAFKDVALQFLGNLFEFFLKRRGGKDFLTIVGATSGDTGSAAIYGLRGKENIEVYILHPKGRVSPIQEKQMTTVLDDNIQNIALPCTFDDCQNIVKDLFNDLDFKKKHHLGAINSINWARILAQIVYYLSAFFQTRTSDDLTSPEIQFSVPTGNFGDVLAGFYAMRIGVPIKKLLVATNQNDILDRFFQTGSYQRFEEALVTLSPAMDIQISSNFERYLFYLSGSDGEKLKGWMDEFKATNKVVLDESLLTQARQIFSSAAVTDEETSDCIKRYEQQKGKNQLKPYVLCPHTAVGVVAAEKKFLAEPSSEDVITVSLATAHPAKFGDAVKNATGSDPSMPKALEELEHKPSRVHEIEASSSAVKDFLLRQTRLGGSA